MLSKLRIAVRRLAKSPGFTGTALATLALCIGANLAIFAVVDAILIRSLPFPHSDRLVTLYYTYPKLPSAQSGASLTNYYERRGKIPALSSLAEISETTSGIGETGATSIENVGRVTPEFLSTLGVAPLMGRAFTDAEMTYQTDQVAMLSYESWSSQHAGDPNILGKKIRTDGLSRTIVGVLPKGFRFLSFQAPVYMPLSSEEGERNVGTRHSVDKIMIGRIADGSSLAAVRAQIDALDAAIAPEFPDAKIVSDAGCRTVVAPLQADYVASVRPTLLILQTGAAFLLVIGCVNLVNLLLIRASNRSRELAIRLALGASQRHVVGDVMTETVVLTVAGGFLGLCVGAAGMRLLGALGAGHLPLGAQIEFSWRVAAVALLAAFVTGIAVGAPVAWLSMRSGFAAALHSESRGSTASRATQGLRHGFIVAQVALAFVLLSGAGLLGLSLRRAMSVLPGFRPDHVMTGQFNLTWNGYHDINSFYAFFDGLYDKARALPGVVAVGAISDVPMKASPEGDVVTVVGHVLKPGESILVHDEFGVAGDYFAAMGIPLREGRFFQSKDARGEQQICVVDDTFAHQYWPEGGAVGKLLYRGTSQQHEDKPYTVVGVVGTIRQKSLTDTLSRGAVYFPYSQLFRRDYYLVARTSLAPEALASALAKAVRAVDPEIPLTDLRSMDVRIYDSLATRRSPAFMAGIFAFTALLLAAIGLYGVMAYAVVQRTREFGVRLALGAQRADVLRLVLGQGVRLAAMGLAAGLAAALLLTGFMSSLLFGLTASNPLAYAGVAAVLAAVAGLACLIPALRATRVDPNVALRCE